MTNKTEVILLVDAENAFNRKVLLHNIECLCPELATFLSNCHVIPVRQDKDGKQIMSREGTT